MALILSWIIFSIVIGIVATNKSRSFFVYFFVSLLLSPLIGLLFVAFADNNSEYNGLLHGTLKKCPICAESVKKEALKCKHCNADLPKED